MIHVRATLAALSLSVLGGGAEAALPKMKGAEFAHAATIGAVLENVAEGRNPD